MLALTLLLLGSPDNRGAKAAAELTVAAVVTSSVSVTIAADGKQTIIVANAPADEAALVAAASRKVLVPVHKQEAYHQIRNAAHDQQKALKRANRTQ